MTLTFPVLRDHINHAIGGAPSAPLDHVELVNQAGEYLTTIHPWKWLENQEAKLNLRANVTATGLNFEVDYGDNGAKSADRVDRLYHSSHTPFSTYTKVSGDLLEITSGTGVRKGFYVVDGGNTDPEAGTGGSMVTVEHNPLIMNTGPIANADLTNNDIACTIHCNRIQLPYDFAELIAIDSSSGLLNGVELTSYEDLLQKKSSTFDVGAGSTYWAAVGHSRDRVGTNVTTTNSNPFGMPEEVTPSLEIWPTPPANETAGLTIYYRAGWPSKLYTLANTQDALGIRIPRYLEAFFIQIVRAFAQGYEDQDVSMLDQRLTSLLQGSLFQTAINRDGGVQPHYGAIHNGAAQRISYGSGFDNFTSIAAPS